MTVSAQSYCRSRSACIIIGLLTSTTVPIHLLFCVLSSSYWEHFGKITEVCHVYVCLPVCPPVARVSAKTNA